jgi:tRNA pseudouridine13 synthase
MASSIAVLAGYQPSQDFLIDHLLTLNSSAFVFVIAPGDEELLVKYFGKNLKDNIIQLHQKILAKPGAKPAVFGALFTEPITDRPLRGRLHQDVRRIFTSRLETEVVDDTGVIKITAAPPIKPVSTFGV